MQIISYPNVDSFLKESQDFLLKEETKNSLLLGLSIGLKQVKNTEGSRFFSVQDEGVIQLVAMNTPGRYLILSSSTGTEAISSLANYILEHQIDYPGIIGPKESSLPFAELICERKAITYEFEMKNFFYELRQVAMPPKLEGKMRIADSKDIPMVGQWMSLFAKEAMDEITPLEKARKIATQKIKEGQIYLWEEKEKLCAMAAKARPTANGMSVNYVYTPKEKRRKGYAALLVAELSQSILDDGYTFCTLFADSEFPTSNRIYKKIGYQEMGLFYNIRFL